MTDYILYNLCTHQLYQLLICQFVTLTKIE
nr:MAG TPA: hypothetical protein [Caudoviricetes sp.]